MPYYYRSIKTPLSQKLFKMHNELKTREEIYKEMHPMTNMKFGMLDIFSKYKKNVHIGVDLLLIKFIEMKIIVLILLMKMKKKE